jgi:thiamine-phosphate pyrophosphorylase
MDLRAALHLVFIVDAQTAGRGDHLDAAFGGGVSAVWLREPGASGDVLYRAARDLAVRCRSHGAALIVGDRADVALAAGAHGVQIGHRSPPAKHVRPWFPGWLGVSCHGAGDLERAAQAGADYAVLSPVYGVPEKGTPLGTEKFAAFLRESADLPVVALGGIETSNVDAVRATGAAGIAVIRALRDAADPVEVARALSAR